MQHRAKTVWWKINGEKTTIGHFIVSENLCNLVSEYSYLQEGDNLSDHSPVRLQVVFTEYCRTKFSESLFNVSETLPVKFFFETSETFIILRRELGFMYQEPAKLRAREA